jgi:hypothetical protein
MFKSIKGCHRNDWWDATVLPSGQTIKIEFQFDESSDRYYYSIYLVTMDKRKSEHTTPLKTTGRDGLRGLLWAKQKIIEFEAFILDRPSAKPITMCCIWTDNRRRDVYARGLKSLGYNFTMLFGRKVLAKQLA